LHDRLPVTALVSFPPAEGEPGVRYSGSASKRKLTTALFCTEHGAGTMINDRITPRQDDTTKPEVREDDRADPVENGMFRMMPSGDIVDLAERNRRLVKAGN
jgi:hypothetical protein